ncbi:hypothetical protein LZ518_03705 [Sphingomonas sp. RB56-2]|uniref:histidine kinase n=1 Tax=Sphingomonas brevis TaxID=2908206 RepID=A0ABT0S7Z9_9SPHN|nr:histidine kinase dimerization/phospho-acceptor domain-containing protein [Sphingomonas brevis]MCL6740241.1 hypothetical protein [Sphingomonas brevis]
MTQPVADAHDRTVRWRQLVDLLSRPHYEIDPALLDAALTMVRTGMRSVARPIRAATARSIAGRAAEPRLIAIFAGDRLEVAAPLLAAAPLNDAGWAEVAAAASKEVASFMRTIRGDVSEASEPIAEESAAPAAEEPHPSIGDIAARIERLKTKREAGEPELMDDASQDLPRPPAALPQHSLTPGLFRWECDAAGEIGWVEGAPRGALIGRSLPGEEGAPRELIRAFTDRLPFEDTLITLPTPALDGDWRLSGIPAFSPVDGRFLGYRGIARREGQQVDAPSAPPKLAAAADAEALRETIHEIKTPLNAIIGFAEIIDGQYLGPAHRNYRQRAAEIVVQARMLLAAIEDLDFAARLQGRQPGKVDAAPLAEIMAPLVEEWANQALANGVQLRVSPQTSQLRSSLDRDLAERLLKRFLRAVIDSTAAHETIHVEAKEGRGRLTIAVSRPATTLHLGESRLFDPAYSTEATGEGASLGLGFALRLVRGLARLAGGDLRLSASDLTLILPLA